MIYVESSYGAPAQWREHLRFETNFKDEVIEPAETLAQDCANDAQDGTLIRVRNPETVGLWVAVHGSAKTLDTPSFLFQHVSDWWEDPATWWANTPEGLAMGRVVAQAVRRGSALHRQQIHVACLFARNALPHWDELYAGDRRLAGGLEVVTAWSCGELYETSEDFRETERALGVAVQEARELWSSATRSSVPRLRDAMPRYRAALRAAEQVECLMKAVRSPEAAADAAYPHCPPNRKNRFRVILQQNADCIRTHIPFPELLVALVSD